MAYPEAILQSVSPKVGCFTDLGKLNLLMVVWFWARANFQYCPAAFKNTARFKRGQKWPENNHLGLLI